MSQKLSIKNNIKFYILSFIIISVYTFLFTFNPSTTKAYAAAVDQALDAGGIALVSNDVETYTVNFYNGTEGIGAFNISPGDQYILAQTGYSINGNMFEFTGKHKMNNCAYGDYYGLPTIDNVTVATYSGWSLNGTMISNSGIWMEYESSILNIYAVWTPVNFTVELNDEYTGNSSTDVNYFDGITLPNKNRDGFEFKGWETSDGLLYQSYTTLHPIEDIELTAKWEEVFEVRLISSEHRNYDRTWEGTIGDTFTLPSLTSGNYYVSQWGTYQVGAEYTIIGDATLYAVWKGNTYTITYENLEFMGQTADVLWDNYLYQYAPTEYEYGVGLDLTRVSAFWQSDSPYSPQLRFLGWCSDETLETPVTNISASATGAKTLYAKWRYDQDNPSRWGTYYIDNSDPLDQDYDRLYLGLTTNGLADELEQLGIDTLVIKFWIEIKGTGTASIHLYNGDTILQTRTIADSEFSDDKFYVCECTFTIALSQIENLTYIDIRYQASTSGWWIFSSSDNWQTESIYYEKFYVANESDADSPELYWHYQFPYDE